MSYGAGVLTERIDIPVPGAPAMSAYLARPAPSGPHPGVIVAHELFGVTAHVRDVCERVAALGFTVVAPDFYHRSAPWTELPHEPAGRERGFELLHQLRREQALADVDAVVKHLQAAGCPRLGIIGLSLGGHIAYLAATQFDLAATVALYPGWLTGTEIGLSRPEPTLALTRGVRGRMLLLCGQGDHAVPASDQDAIAEALASANVGHEMVSYPGAAHGFLCDRRDTFDPAAAADAWRRIETLLVDELR